LKKLYQSSNPKIAKEIQHEIDKIKKVIQDLQFARNQLVHNQEILEEPKVKVKKEIEGIKEESLAVIKTELSEPEEVDEEVKQEVEKIVKETESNIKKADTIEIPTKLLNQFQDDLTKIKENTSHPKRNMIIAGAISFVAGVLSTLAVQYLNNINGN